MTQLGIFDARQRRDDGIARAEAGALESFKAEAFSALRAYLERNPGFFCDDFWASEEAKRIHSPANLKAFGPVIQRARREGLMVPSGEHRPSKASHLSPKPCWTSLVYRGTQP
jgi:hypothetical protein